MAPDPATPRASKPSSETFLSRVLAGMSVFSMFMTLPQIYTIWVGHQAAGVSVISWGAYMLSAVLWFWYGVRKKDRNIYLPCVGWAAMDAAVIVGAIIYG